MLTNIDLRLLCLFCFLTLSCLPLSAHEGRLEGQLLDAETRLPIVGAEIRLPAQKTLTLSDELGYFSLEGLTPGSFLLTAHQPGYEPQKVAVQIDTLKPEPLRISLVPRMIDMEAVVISERTSPGQGLKTIQPVDLQLRPIRTSQDVLRSIPGLFIAQHAGGGKAEQIFLRGFDIDHGTDIQLTVDGMPVNLVSHAHGQGYADLHFVIPETIEKVDFNKGPYQANKGNFATAGYAAFQTREALDKSLFKLEAGQFQTLRGVGMIDLLPSNREHHAYVATEYMQTDGYFDASQNFHRVNAMARYSGMVGERSRLSISASTFDSEWDASGQIPVRAIQEGQIGRFGAIDSTEGGHTQRQNLNLQWTHSPQAGTFIRQQVFYSRYGFELFSNFTFFLEDSLNGDQIRQSENRAIYGYNGAFEQEYSLGGTRMKTEVGLQIRVDDIQDNELSRTQNRTDLLERLAYGDVRESNAGIYVDQSWWSNSGFAVNVGLRYDQFQYAYEDQLTEAYDPQVAREGIFSPKVNLSWTFSPALQLYVNMGSGFHSNDTRLVLAQATQFSLPRALGSDVGVVMKPLPGMLVQAAIWGLRMEQEFVYVGDAGIVEPSGQTLRAGVDLSVRYQATPWLFFDGDLTYTHARLLGEAVGEAYIPLAPIMSSVGGATLRLPMGLEAGLRYRYLGDRPANETYSLVADGYTLLDASLSYQLRNLRFFLNLENLTNTEWREAQFETESRLREETEPVSEIHFTPGTPRFLRLGVEVAF